MPVLKMCKDGCGRSIIAWDTVTNRCAKCTEKRRKARSKAKAPKPLKRSTKPIAKVGKQGKKTAAAVAKWKRGQQPNHEGYYVCYMCKKWIPYLVAEHVKSKARHPELRTDPNNLKPTCDDCNREKGSRDN